MPHTKRSKVADVRTSRHFSEEIANPIKPERFSGFHEARLGKEVRITQFGVNHVTLEPGMWSSLRHWHEKEDEFVFVLSGGLTLVDNNGSHVLPAGAFAGFPAGEANAHHLMNQSDKNAEYIVIGSRRPGEDVTHYPDDDLGPIQR